MRHDLSFQYRLNKILKETYVSPDEIYNYCSAGESCESDSVTFIYNSDGIIFYDRLFDSTHADIIKDNIDYFIQYFDKDDSNIYNDDKNWSYDDDDEYMGEAPEYDYQFMRTCMQDIALLGRAGTMDAGDDVYKHYLSFWNTEEGIYEALLEPCLQRLEQDDIITQDTILSIPHIPLMRIGDTKKQIGTKLDKLDDEQLEKIRMMRELHLMKPQAKRAAMLKLGLNPNSNKNKWQKGSEEAGIVQPGQKWWAPTSESRE